MYYSHFGLNQPPFRITPDTEFFYSGGNRGPILDALIYAIGQGEGIIKVTGEVGSGKTMLCSMLQARLPENVETVYIVNPSVSPEEILHAIALELQLKPPRDAGHLEVMQMLHHHLLELHAQDEQVVMFVEESQSMPIATLEEIRLLSNLETARSKLLQIVLFGQPELEENLRRPNIRQLRERISHSFRLSPLKNDEVRDYLNFRLRAAGYRGPELFSPAVVRAIGKASEGLTRRINLIADKALLAAFSENTHTVRLKHVKAAVRDSEFSSYEPPQYRFKLGLALSLFSIGAGLGIALFALFQAYKAGYLPALERPTAAPASTSDRDVVKAPKGPIQVSNPAPALQSSLPQPLPAAAATGANAKPVPPEQTKGELDEANKPLLADEKRFTESEQKHVSAQAGADIEPLSSKVSPNSRLLESGEKTVDARLAATRAWLAQQPETAYSIQLMGADNPQQLKNYLNVITKYIEMNDIFVYRTLAKQKPSLTVLYGAFSDRRAAQDALLKLPASLKAHKPILRTVQGIRAEIAQHQPS